MPYQIAVVQFEPVRKNPQENVRRIKTLLSGMKADLIVLPELANSGYLYENSQELLPFSESRDGQGDFISALISLAEQTEGVIVSGYAERAADQLYNSAIAVASSGVIENYRKIHLYADEKLLFQPGDGGFKVFSWQGVKIGMMVCFDWIFPEAARSLALSGAQIVAHPANLVMPYCQDAMITRSIENRIFTITANRIGTETAGNRILSFTGGSQITDPTGSVLYRGPKDKPIIHITEIEPQTALNKNISPKNDLFDDRKPDFYQLITP